jgi:hypothetical protein
VVAAIDRDGKKAALGKSAQQRELAFLIAAGPMQRDHYRELRASVLRNFDRNSRHAFRGFRVVAEPLGKERFAGLRADPGLGGRCDAGPVDQFLEGLARRLGG